MGFWRRAEEDPSWTAIVEPDGTEVGAGDLLTRVNQLTAGLRAAGLRPGDGIAALLPNSAAAFEVLLSALQAGWYLTPINWHFTPPEIGYLVADSGAKAFFVHERFAESGGAAADLVMAGAAGAENAAAGSSEAGSAEAASAEAGSGEGAKLLRFSFGDVPGFTSVTDLRRGQPAERPADRTAGATMHYTSGTTGRPKGVRRALSGIDPDDAGDLGAALPMFFGVTAGQPNAHLLTSPVYHTAVTVFGGSALQMGHTIVCMDGWDSQRALELVDRYKVTNSHMVPTQFKRMLSLPEETRRQYDVSSMRWLIHAAAPCPPGIKREMLDWWGPCVYEYYAATEGGGTIASPQDWLAHPGTVGTPWPVSEVIVVDDAGERCPAGLAGTVYMKMSISDFEYKGDPAKTAANRLNDFFTVGDIGYLDDDGFLFLCDRKSDMIISGGANIYPAEIEAELIMHPAVADVAVFGIPDADWGEQIKAVIELLPDATAGDELAADILASLDGRLARMKWPKSIDFTDALPRDPSGKLLKRRLRDPYWQGHGTSI